MKDLPPRAHVVVTTSNVRISRRQKIAPMSVLCSTIVFPHSTNHIINWCSCRLRFLNSLLGSLSMQRFWATDGHRKYTVFLFHLSSHYHIYIFKSLCASRDDYFENLGETNVLACKMFTSGCRSWLKNVACLSSLLTHVERALVQASVHLAFGLFCSIKCLLLSFSIPSISS